MDFVERLFIDVDDIALTRQGLKLILTHLEKKKLLKSITHCSCLILLFQKVLLTFVTMVQCERGSQFKVDYDEDYSNSSWFKDLDLQKLENFQISGRRCNVHLKIWSVNTFDTWHLYQKHHVVMSITNLHALNPKELINYLSKFMLQVAKNNGNLYLATRLYNLRFFFGFYFVTTILSLWFFLFVLWNEFFFVVFYYCCVTLQCYFMLSIKSSSLEKIHDEPGLMCLN
jgi:hypothetical protein